MQALHKAHNFAALNDAATTQRLVLSKQSQVLDTVLVRLQTAIAGMDALVQEQERTCLVAWRALGAGCPAPEAGKLLDAGLSPAALVEAVEGLWWVQSSRFALP
ncbi:MAG: hypothetical protein WDW38_003420 [Sanguina aurantia]